MSKRTHPTKRGSRNLKSRDPVQGMAEALSKRPKEELVQALLELARQDPKASRRITNYFGIPLSGESLVSETRRAIACATDFDEREANQNFDYDSEAYETVQRNLATLAKSGLLEQAMELSLELMRRGSYQAEQSDEGLMTDEIEECLEAVLKAVRGSTLPAQAIAAWSREMMRADRGEFICRDALEALEKRAIEAGK